MTIVVLWRRCGPYHRARLGGLRARCAGKAGVIGLQVANSDHYQWATGGGHGDEVQTLFSNRSYESIPTHLVAAAVEEALGDLAPDAVAVNGWSVPEARAALRWCSRRPGVPAVLMSETKEDDSRRWLWKEAIKRRLVQRADAALVGGRAQRAYLLKLGMPAERIFLGYDVVDNDHFRSGADRARAEAPSIRARLRLPRRYFFACTRLLPRKNIDGLLRAYAQYRRQRGAAAWGLVVAGSGRQEQRLRELAGRLALADLVWPGFVQYHELPAYFGLAAAFIHPARQEAWGLVVNEAAASGLPLLVSHTVGARYELVEDGDNGFLFDPGHDADIAAAMKRVSDLQEANRRRMGERSREIVDQWSPRRFGEQMLAAIDAGRRSKAGR